MDEAKQAKSPESFRRNFYLFERANAKEFEALKAASNQRFFAWNHGINFKDNRDMIRRTVFVRAKITVVLTTILKIWMKHLKLVEV